MKIKIVLLSIIIIGTFLAISTYKKYRTAPSIEFASLTLTDLEGNKTSLQNYAGKNIFIMMWAPWCKDCIVEMPALQYVKDQLEDDDFVFLAISGYDREKEKAFAEKFPYDFEYLHMEEKLQEIGIFAIPTNYIINKKGKVVYNKVGPEKDWLSKRTLQKIKNLVKD